MAVILDEGQTRMVATKRMKPGSRPTYYDAVAKGKREISEDFEAFLVLLNNTRSKMALEWLQESGEYAVQDADRDSLLNSACDNEIEDAEASYKEIQPIVDRFSTFREAFLLTGFEAVPEVGLILADIQRPMAQIMSIASRLKYRMLSATLIQETLKTDGITPEMNRQIDSWAGPLTAY